MPNAIDIQDLIRLRRSSHQTGEKMGLNHVDVAEINRRLITRDNPDIALVAMGLQFINMVYMGVMIMVAWCPKARHVAFFVQREAGILINRYAHKHDLGPQPRGGGIVWW